MNSQELSERLGACAGTIESAFKMGVILDEFFKDKVIIQKGSNRHPCADVLHEWAECPSRILEYRASMDGWCRSNWSSSNEYRIKPQEPVYEYMVADNNGVIDWMTIDEFDKQSVFAFRATKTKRERK